MQQVYEGGTPLCQLNASIKKKDVNPQLKSIQNSTHCLCSSEVTEEHKQTPTPTSFPSQGVSLHFVFLQFCLV